MNVQTLQPEPPDPRVEETRSFWRDLGRAMVRESIATIDETARQIITVAGVLEGLYFHAITFGDLRGKVPGGWPLAIYLAPIVLLLFSLCAGLLVFFPAHYRLNLHSSQASQEVHERVVASKLRLMRIAAVCLILAIVGIAGAVWVYLRGV
ncbi:MAG: hypothetical protein ACJ8CR_12505 [Roseiflexaceae bacterium]